MRGALLWFRTGSDVVIPNAFRFVDPHDRLTDDRGAESAGNGADFTGDRFAFPLGEVRCRELSVEAAPVLGE